MPVDLMNPEVPLYIMPVAMPASGKSTFAKLYKAYIRAQDPECEVIIINKDEIIFEVMAEVNKARGYALGYKGMHPENWLNQDGSFVGIDPDTGEAVTEEQAKEAYFKAKSAMRQVLEILAGKEVNGRTRMANDENLVVIHDDLNLTKEGRRKLRTGTSVGTVVRTEWLEARKKLVRGKIADLLEATQLTEEQEAEVVALNAELLEENNVPVAMVADAAVLTSARYGDVVSSEELQTTTMLFELTGQEIEAMLTKREAAGGHGVPRPVMEYFHQLYVGNGSDDSPDNRPTLDEGFEDVGGEIPHGRMFADGIAEMIGFTPDGERSATLVMLDAFKAAGYPFDKVSDDALMGFVQSRIDKEPFAPTEGKFYGEYSAFDCAVYAIIDACAGNMLAATAEKAVYEASKISDSVRSRATGAARVRKSVSGNGLTTEGGDIGQAA